MNAACRLLLAFSAFVLLASCGTRKPEYGIGLEKQTIDIGTVYTDSAVRNLSVAYTNTGRNDLVINDVKTDCNCTTVKFSSQPLSSGSHGKLDITIDLRNFFPMEIEKHVAVYSNATKEPLMIDIIGEVKRKE